MLDCEDNKNTNCGPKVTSLFKNIVCVMLVLLINSAVWCVWCIFLMCTVWYCVHTFVQLLCTLPESFRKFQSLCSRNIPQPLLHPPPPQHVTIVGSTRVVLNTFTPLLTRNCVSVLSFHVNDGTVLLHHCQSIVSNKPIWQCITDKSKYKQAVFAHYLSDVIPLFLFYI
jgi:hypothetical protein